MQKSVHATMYRLDVECPTMSHEIDILSNFLATKYLDHFQFVSGQPGNWPAFADRQYTDEGHLVSRHLDGSVHDKPALLAQVKQLLTEGCVTTRSGNTLNLNANSLCVHGDNAAGIALIKEIKSLCASAT